MNQQPLQLLAAIPGEVFLILGFVTLIGITFIARRRMHKREKAMGTFDDPVMDGKVRSDLEELAVQVQEIAREQIAKADVKIRMLNQLMMEADQKKQELTDLLSQERPPQEVITEKEAPAPPVEVRPTNPLHEKIFSLSDAGKSQAEICGETGLEIGEVEMILGIRKL